MEAARAAKTIDFNKEFRMGLDVQRAEIEAQKLVEKEKFESELALRRSLEAALKDQVCMYFFMPRPVITIIALDKKSFALNSQFLLCQQ